MAPRPRFKDRIALVTGASRGLGRAVALALAREGAHIVVCARTAGALEEVDDEIRATGGKATILKLDLRAGDRIDQLGPVLYQRWGKLDMLLGNAGVLGVVTPLGHLEPKVFEEVMAVNVTANWRLIRSLDPLLRQSDAGRALFVTSGAAERCRPYWGAYSASKAALQALVRTYAGELKGTRATANLIDPGPLRTKMRPMGRPGEDPETVQLPEVVAPDIVRMLSPDYTATGVIFRFADHATTELSSPIESSD